MENKEKLFALNRNTYGKHHTNDSENKKMKYKVKKNICIR